MGDGRDVEGRERINFGKKTKVLGNEQYFPHFPRKYKILDELLYKGFCDFFEIFLKILETDPFKKATWNALISQKVQSYPRSPHPQI
jgi:hypothetical protein